MLALFTTSCRSSRTVTQQTYSEAVHDTVIETVTLTLHDTIRETTTITIQTNATGDTTKLLRPEINFDPIASWDLVRETLVERLKK